MTYEFLAKRVIWPWITTFFQEKLTLVYIRSTGVQLEVAASNTDALMIKQTCNVIIYSALYSNQIQDDSSLDLIHIEEYMPQKLIMIAARACKHPCKTTRHTNLSMHETLRLMEMFAVFRCLVQSCFELSPLNGSPPDSEIVCSNSEFWIWKMNYSPSIQRKLQLPETTMLDVSM